MSIRVTRVSCAVAAVVAAAPMLPVIGEGAAWASPGAATPSSAVAAGDGVLAPVVMATREPDFVIPRSAVRGAPLSDGGRNFIVSGESDVTPQDFVCGNDPGAAVSIYPNTYYSTYDVSYCLNTHKYIVPPNGTICIHLTSTVSGSTGMVWVRMTSYQSAPWVSFPQQYEVTYGYCWNVGTAIYTQWATLRHISGPTSQGVIFVRDF